MNPIRQIRKIRFKERSKITSLKSQKWQAPELNHIHGVFPKTGLKQWYITTFAVTVPQAYYLRSN